MEKQLKDRWWTASSGAPEKGIHESRNNEMNNNDISNTSWGRMRANVSTGKLRLNGFYCVQDEVYLVYRKGNKNAPRVSGEVISMNWPDFGLR